MKWTVGNGIDEYISQLMLMDKTTDATVGKAIYQGAKIVADKVRSNIDSLPVRESKQGKIASSGVTSSQKKGLQEGFGISHKEIDGSFVNVKLGFDGYNSTKTQKYPNGQPNAMVARFVESGNSYHTKTPFIGPAVRSTKDQAEGKMKTVVDESINQIFK